MRSIIPAVTLASSAFAQLPTDQILVPIHSHEVAIEASRGSWAAGPDYKARFDGGFRYFPVLGSNYPDNLPLAWQTGSVRIGTTDFLGGKSEEVRVDDYRYEYRHARVVEAYEVRLDGVEQTFLIERLGESAGDLVVRGRISSPLTSPVREPAHKELEFRDSDRQTILRYGAATAIDADGRRFPMTSAYDGERIELRLNARLVNRARFPLLVDPIIGNDSAREAGRTANAAIRLPNATSSSDPAIQVYTRISSANDHDVFALLTDSTPTQLVALAWAEISTATSEEIAACAIDDSQRIVIASELNRSCVIYSHDVNDTTFASGPQTIIPSQAMIAYSNPVLGGALSGTAATMVCEVGANANTRISAYRIDAATAAWTPLGTLAADDPLIWERHPAITSHGPDWIASWVVRDNAATDIVARKIFADGSFSSLQVIRPASNNRYAGVRIAGRNGHYVATYAQSPLGIGAAAIRAQRFDWVSTAPPVPIALSTLHSGGTGYVNGDIAYDAYLSWQWAATYQRDIGLFGRRVETARIGDVGAVVEVRDIHGVATEQPFAPSICFGGDRPGRFLITYATSATPSNAVFGEPFRYPSECFQQINYGSSCNGIIPFAAPTIAGWPGFSVTQFVGPGFQGAAACAVSLARTSVPLDRVGMTGCTLLADPAAGAVLPGVIDAQGMARAGFSLGGPMPFIGQFHMQWIFSAAGANPAGLVTTVGITREVR